jgi:hypothetical protein
MTPPQDKLRAALRQTANEIPAEAPPLRLNPQPRMRNNGRDPHPRRRGWAAPLTAAALVVAVIVASVAVAGRLKHQPATSASAGPDGIPAYYVALIAQQPRSGPGTVVAQIRSTETGAVLAKVEPPGPYVNFTSVTGAADDRTFVLSARGPNLPYPAQRFFLLRILAASRDGARWSLTALPAAFTPGHTAIAAMALSPDGTTLAAEVGTAPKFSFQLYLFNLATGTRRVFGTRTCSQCLSPSGGLGYAGVNVDALSWTADSQHVAFAWQGTIRLLDTRAPGSNIMTASKPVATWPNASAIWHGAIITPDGRTVLGIEVLPDPHRFGPLLPERLVTISTATRKQTAVLNNLTGNANFGFTPEVILYTNADGSVLVLHASVRPGGSAAIVRDGHSIRLPWSPDIYVAAW